MKIVSFEYSTKMYSNTVLCCYRTNNVTAMDQLYYPYYNYINAVLLVEAATVF